MCNCAGLQISNCVGNPDCTCNGAYSTYSRSSNLSGEIQPLTAPTIQLSTTVGTIPAPTAPTAPTTTSPTTGSTTGTTINKVLDFGSTLLGMFGSKSSTPAPLPLPEEDKKVPTAVWVVVGGLLLLIVVFVIVKAKK